MKKIVADTKFVDKLTGIIFIFIDKLHITINEFHEYLYVVVPKSDIIQESELVNINSVQYIRESEFLRRFEKVEEYGYLYCYKNDYGAYVFTEYMYRDDAEFTERNPEIKEFQRLDFSKGVM
jgi:hypothetical protein